MPTLREELEQVEKQSGERPDELDEIEIPIVALNIWETFFLLAAGEALTASEIEAWQKVSGERLEPWEAVALLRMDRAVNNFLVSRARKKTNA